MAPSLTAFVNRQNIRRFEQELAITPEGHRRKMLLRLMAEEWAKGRPEPSSAG